MSGPGMVELKPMYCDGLLEGFRVKTTQWCHVDVLATLYPDMWHLAATNLVFTQLIDRNWRYVGEYAFGAALAQALKWDGSPDTAPAGWVKELHTGRRADGSSDRD